MRFAEEKVYYHRTGEAAGGEHVTVAVVDCGCNVWCD
jgi:hypothetical protein